MRMVRLFLKLSHDFIWSQLYKTLDQFSIKLSKSNVLQHFANIKIYFFQGNERLYNKLIINYFLQLNVKFVDHLTGFFFFLQLPQLSRTNQRLPTSDFHVSSFSVFLFVESLTFVQIFWERNSGLKLFIYREIFEPKDDLSITKQRPY